MVMRTLATVALLVLTASHANAQWMKKPNPSVPRTRAGEADLAAPAPKGPSGRPDLSGVWVADTEPVPPEAGPSVEGDFELPRYFINVAADLDPGDVPLRPWAAELLEKRLASNGRDEPVAHCKPTGVPEILSVPLPYKIVQTSELIVILYEENSVFRQIFLDGREPVADPEPRSLGYSRGRWDGAELVVETTGFSDRHWLDGMGHPLTTKLKVTERYRRVDAGHLEIRVTIDDPGAYTRPFGYTIKSTLVPSEDLLEYFCTDNEKDAQYYQ
jgi:hypothetical protein